VSQALPPPHSYESKLLAEKRHYSGLEDIHELPPIFHYWSNRWLRPQLERFDFSRPDSFFLKSLDQQLSSSTSSSKLILSVGSGNCDLEINLAGQLTRAGHSDFQFHCLDLNPDMLARGRESAKQRNIGSLLHFIEADFNHCQLTSHYDAILFNQSLHHVVSLEHLLDQVKQALLPSGRLVISDMIGRNGHQRWPSALHSIWQHWSTLPPSYRFNNAFDSYEELYVDRDYSSDAFEGIRAEDILPQLLSRFDFEFFFGFANLIDPFIDRGFGPNFDPNLEHDRQFIDHVHAADEAAIHSGELPPTHMLAVLCHPGQSKESKGNLDPQACIQSRTRAQAAPTKPHNLYDFHLDPAERTNQLHFLGKITTQSSERLERSTQLVRSLVDEVHQKNAWALGLDQALAERDARVATLQAEVSERNAWAQDMQLVIDKADTELLTLREQLNDRTTWARQLEADLTERTNWALALDKEVSALKERNHALSADLATFSPAIHLVRKLLARFGIKSSGVSGC
jgi:SAM-dependent methyltransferase